MQLAERFGDMTWRLRFPGTLHARLTVVFSGLVLLGSVLVTGALARDALRTELDAQTRVAEHALQVLNAAVAAGVPGEQLYGLDGYVNRLADDPAIGAIRVVDAAVSKLYEYAGVPGHAAWYTRLLAGETRAARRLLA